MYILVIPPINIGFPNKYRVAPIVSVGRPPTINILQLDIKLPDRMVQIAGFKTKYQNQMT